ncbi:MAG: fumarate hydratase C-terminal domain-containing protein [Enterobacteriaceae bacterium]
MESGEGLPQYVKDHPIYTRVRQNACRLSVRSLGPTTAGRMDSTLTVAVSRRQHDHVGER